VWKGGSKFCLIYVHDKKSSKKEEKNEKKSKNQQKLKVTKNYEIMKGK